MSGENTENLTYDHLSTICRVCLSCEFVQPFELNLFEIFNSILYNFEDEIERKLPQNICKTCLVELQKIEMFILKYKNNKDRLKAIYISNNTFIDHADYDLSSVKCEEMKANNVDLKSNILDNHYNRIINFDDFGVICRFCLSYGSLKSINLEQTELCKVISNNANDENDEVLPQNVCESCSFHLLHLKQFIRKCKNSEEILKTMSINTNLYTNYCTEQKSVEFQWKYENIEDGEINIKDEESEITDTKQFRKYKFVCDTCGKGLMKRKEFERHVKLHSTSYVCKDCGKRFIKHHNFEKHLLTHKDKLYLCSRIFCRKVFTTIYYLRLHMRQPTCY